MNVKRVGLAITSAVLVTACTHDKGPFVAPVVSLAYTRFVSAVPDTGAMDWRFIDAIANSPFALGQAYRGFTPYQATAPGARHLRIFPTSTNISITSQIVQDATLTFEANKYYTIVHVGLARRADSDPMADKLVVFEDNFPDPGASIALRVINLGPGLNTGAPGSVDVFATTATGDATPATPMFSGVAFLGATGYVTRATGGLAMRATAAGTITPVLANVLAQTGVDADPALTGSTIGGSKEPGSVMTAFVFGRTTVGSAAGQTGTNANPTIVYVVDRRPQ
jgi:Domain of unknown function (DUF4397)